MRANGPTGPHVGRLRKCSHTSFKRRGEEKCLPCGTLLMHESGCKYFECKECRHSLCFRCGWYDGNRSGERTSVAGRSVRQHTCGPGNSITLYALYLYFWLIHFLSDSISSIQQSIDFNFNSILFVFISKIHCQKVERSNSSCCPRSI